MIYKIVDIFFIEILVGNEILSTFAATKRHEVVSSSSLVRTSGFHPGNSGSNPGETTNQARQNSGLFYCQLTVL